MMLDKVITVFGGSGFLGKHIVGILASSGYIVKIVSRHPEIGDELRILGRVGQISSVYGDAAQGGEGLENLVAGSYAVINTVGSIIESRGSSLMVANAKTAENIARAVERQNIPRFVHISTFAPTPRQGDTPPTSLYLRSKYMGENAVRKSVPRAVILRPNIIVGQDNFFFRIVAKILKYMPVMPLIYTGRIQPVLVSDMARAVVCAMESDLVQGRTYCAMGDKSYTLRDLIYLVERSVQHSTCHRANVIFIKMGKRLTKIMSYILNSLFMRLCLRAFTGSYRPLLTPEQAEVLSYDLLLTDKSNNIFNVLNIPTSSVALSLAELEWF